ncbi:MAG: chorismate synthase [Treponema sp.]|nr:chorismate synthase [Treponema sp.]
MAGNSFGNIFKVTTFGESHGEALGCIIDGCPSGVPISIEKIQLALDRRKPGASNPATTPRKEADKVEILSGIFDGVSTGTSIALIIKNTNQHSGDYSEISKMFRPGHADYTYFKKYGIRDYRGGGRSSGRETCMRVAAGSIATQVLQAIFSTSEVPQIIAYTTQIADIAIEEIDFFAIEKNLMRCPDMKAGKKMLAKIETSRKNGESVGGIVECVVKNVPIGLGEPVFNKLDAILAQAMLSIGAIKGIEFGAGFGSSLLSGSQNNDNMYLKEGKVFFSTNNAGGILGGITSGQDIVFRLAVKPVPSISKTQKTIDTDNNETEISIRGRHDVCLCPRIVPVVEAMTAICILDAVLQNRCSKY